MRWCSLHSDRRALGVVLIVSGLVVRAYSQQSPAPDPEEPPASETSARIVVRPSAIAGCVTRSDIAGALRAIGAAPSGVVEAQLIDQAFAIYAAQYESMRGRLTANIRKEVGQGDRLRRVACESLSSEAQVSIESALDELSMTIAGACNVEGPRLRQTLVRVSLSNWMSFGLESALLPSGAGVDPMSLLRSAEERGSELEGLRDPGRDCEASRRIDAAAERYCRRVDAISEACFGQVGGFELKAAAYAAGVTVDGCDRFREVFDLQCRAWGDAGAELCSTVSAIAAECGMPPSANAKWTIRWLRALYPTLVPRIDIVEAVLTEASRVGVPGSEAARIAELASQVDIMRAENYRREVELAQNWLRSVPVQDAFLGRAPVPAALVAANRRSRETQIRFANDAITCIASELARDHLRSVVSEISRDPPQGYVLSRPKWTGLVGLSK